MNTHIDPSTDGLVQAYLLDGHGAGRKLSWQDINDWQPEDGLLWVNLAYDAAETHQWIEKNSHLDPIAIASLLAEHSSPRCTLSADGVLLNLRGVNFSPIIEDFDRNMVSLSLWIQAKRIISIQRHHLLSLDEVSRAIDQGIGPRTAGEFVVDLSNELLEKMSTIINALEKRLDALQDDIDTQEPYKTRQKLSLCRRRIVLMRRYVLPQRDALLRMQTDKILWLNDLDRVHLREVSDRTTRYIEDLDTARDRATIVQEELISRTSEQINNKIYVLSLVAVIFMPLSFLVGLLGINVGGIPGSQSIWGFSTVCAIILAVFGLEWLILKRKKWL